MATKLSLIGLIFLILINCQGVQEKTTNNVSDTVNPNSSDLIKDLSPQIVDLPLILDSIKNKLPKIDLSETFNLNKESDDNIDEQFLKLDSAQVAYFYSTKKLREYYDYFNFHSYYYGYNHNSDGMVRVFIINTNKESAIYLDCFVLNFKGEILDVFAPSYIEMQPSYSYFGFGRFLNDSIYKLIAIDYETLDFKNYKATKDSSTTTYMIGNLGKISKSIEKHGIDTVYKVRE